MLRHSSQCDPSFVMKVFLVLLILAFCFKQTYASINLTEEELGDYIKSCLAKSKLSQDFYESSDETLKHLTEEQKSCFLACMFKKTGIIQLDGSIRPVADDVDEVTENQINRCTANAKGDLCKLAWCLFKMEKFGIPIIVNKPRFE